MKSRLVATCSPTHRVASALHPEGGREEGRALGIPPRPLVRQPLIAIGSGDRRRNPSAAASVGLRTISIPEGWLTLGIEP